MSSVEQAASERPRTGEATETGCPECSGAVRQDGRERVCATCGLVVDADWLDRGPEWRHVGDGEVKGFERTTGAPTSHTLHDHGLGSDVGEGASEQLQRAARYNGRINSKRMRTRVGANVEIDRLVSALELGDAVQERASKLFADAQDADLHVGHSRETVAAACVLAAGREAEGVVLRLADVAEVTDARRGRVFARHNEIARELGCSALPPTPSAVVPRVVDQLGASNRLERRARELVLDVERAGLHSGRKPAGVAAAAVYRVGQTTGDWHSQEAVAEAAGVSPQTVRSARRDVVGQLDSAGDGGDDA